MAWIRQVPFEEATGLLRTIYDGGVGRIGEVAGIIRVMSLRPRSLAGMMKFYVEEMLGADSELTRAERELLATVTSKVNDCFY